MFESVLQLHKSLLVCPSSMSYLSVFLLSTLRVLAKAHVRSRGMFASAVWLSVGRGFRSLWSITRPVVPLLFIGHVHCVCQGAREQSISFVGLWETNRAKGGDSVVEHKALLIHLLLKDSCRQGSFLLLLLSKELWHRTSLQGPSITSHCVSVKL